MKSTNSVILAMTAVFGLIYNAGASSVQFPLVRLDISGIVTYSAGAPNDDGTTTKSRLTSVSITTKSLIDLLNASPAVATTLADVTGTNRIPLRSYFVWDLKNEDLIVTNSNGFSFTLRGNDPSVGNYDYGRLEIADDNLIGRYNQDDATGFGDEWDLTGIFFAFDDSNGNSLADYGNGTMEWNFGVVSGGVQKTTLKIDFPAPNGYDDSVNYGDALARNVFISGKAKGDVPSGIFPFYLWW